MSFVESADQFVQTVLRQCRGLPRGEQFAPGTMNIQFACNSPLHLHKLEMLRLQLMHLGFHRRVCEAARMRAKFHNLPFESDS